MGLPDLYLGPEIYGEVRTETAGCSEQPAADILQTGLLPENSVELHAHRMVKRVRPYTAYSRRTGYYQKMHKVG